MEYFRLLDVRLKPNTSEEMDGFANDLGLSGPPFSWNDECRHCLRSELDAVFAQMYGLTRSALKWTLDAQAPSSSFLIPQAE